MVKELREVLRAIWVRLRRTENWIFGMSQMPLIVEEGTDGIWRYRKWSNGVAECWGNTVATAYNMSNTYGSLYYATAKICDFPTGLFIEQPIATVSRTTLGDGLCDASPYAVSTTGINAYVYNSLSGTKTLSFAVYAIGKYKITVDTPQNLIDYLYDNHVWDYNYLDNLPKLNGQIISGNKTLADYGFTGTIANDKMGYTTTAPTAANTDGLKIVVLEEEPETKYDGWLYLIKEPEE